MNLIRCSRKSTWNAVKHSHKCSQATEHWSQYNVLWSVSHFFLPELLSLTHQLSKTNLYTFYCMKFGDDLMYFQVFIVTDLLPFAPLIIIQFLKYLSITNMEILYLVWPVKKEAMLIIINFSLVIQIHSKYDNVPSWVLNRLTVSFNLHQSEWWKICCNRRTKLKLKITSNTCSLCLLLVSDINQNTYSLSVYNWAVW